MPFITIKTNTKISTEKKEKIKTVLGEYITIIGKSENWLMISFEDEVKMYFKGQSNFMMAFVQVDLFGSARKNEYNKFTEKISSLLNSELGIELDKIYVRYFETDNWGWNGNNF